MSERSSSGRVPSRTRPTGGGRIGDRVQALTLLLCSCLSVLGAVLLVPLLPALQREFLLVPGVELLVLLVLTAPALMIALTAAPIGRVAERVGAKQLLLGALLLYAVAGTAPLWLTTLPSIVVSRAVLGIAEAAIMTCSTTLLAGTFDGARRNRYLGLQTVFLTLSATAFLAAGGVLGTQELTRPFWLYAAGLPLAVLVAVTVRPSQDHGGPRSRLPWSSLLAPVGVTVAGGLVFYVPIVQLPDVLSGVGVVSADTIGLVGAISSLATAAGAVLFGRIGRLGPFVAVTTAFYLSGVGIFGLALAGTLPLVIASAVVAGAGTGLLLPAVLTWTLGTLRAAHRVRGIGVWTAALFLGQFACPVVLQLLPATAVAFSPALLVIGGGSLLVGLVAFAIAPSATDRAAG